MAWQLPTTADHQLLTPEQREQAKLALRDQALADMPDVLRVAVDRALADGKLSDINALLGTLSKISGMEAEKKDKYGDLPIINITIGADMTISAAPAPAPLVEQVTPTADPDVVDVPAALPAPALDTPEDLLREFDALLQPDQVQVLDA